jgi:glycosyltransferase involved in cell wall biosynthesis
MKILTILYYYYPYVSGISEYAKRLSEALVKKGHEVTVLTSLHDSKLSPKEHINGVEVIRCAPLFKCGKGPVMPTFVLKSRSMAHKYDVINIHLPLFEAPVLLTAPHKTVITYHCDIKLGGGFLNSVIEKSYYTLARKALRKTRTIVTNTEDYAADSVILRPHLNKCEFIIPPINENTYSRVNAEQFRQKHKLARKKLIGFVGRIVQEKGIGYMLDSIPLIKEQFKRFKVVLAGDYTQVAGGSSIKSLAKKIKLYKEDILLLGKVSPTELLEFYSACDVLVLPSIDPTESFGMVQIEAMYCGTPVVATDLPGVRLPIQLTHMGLIARNRDSTDLAEKIITVLSNKKAYTKSKNNIVKLFSIEKTVDRYEHVFQTIAFAIKS